MPVSDADRQQRQHIVPSTVHVLRHPIHPMLVVFPVALLMLVAPSDLAHRLTGDPFWPRVSFWLLLVGFGAGLLAALVGAVDFATMRRVRSHVSGWSHMLSAIVLLAIAAVNIRLRWDDPIGAIWPWGLWLSAAMAAVVAMTGWLGGTLTFGHSIGTFEHEQDTDVGEDGPPRQ